MLEVQHFMTVAWPLGTLWFKQFEELCVGPMAFTDPSGVTITGRKTILPAGRSKEDG